MLYTNLKHINNAEEFKPAVTENKYAVIVCGRMDTACVPVFQMFESLQEYFDHIVFFDLEYDNPEMLAIEDIAMLRELAALPALLFFKEGRLIKVLSESLSVTQLFNMLNAEFKVLEKA